MRPAERLVDAETEWAFLGALLFAAPNKIPEYAEAVRPEDLAAPGTAETWRAALNLSGAGESVEALTVRARLEVAGELTPPLVARLTDAETEAASTAGLPEYARAIRERAFRRRLLAAGRRIAGLAVSLDVDPAAAREQAEQAMLDAIVHGADESGPRWAREFMKPALDELEHLAQSGDLPGISTGFPTLDEFTMGFQPGQLIIVGARTSVGKTAFTVNNIVSHVAVQSSRPTLVFSLEMSAKELLQRRVLSDAGVTKRDIRAKAWRTDLVMERIGQSAAKVYNSPWLIDETPRLGVSEIRVRARRAKMRTPELSLVVVDHAQIVASPKAESRRLGIAAVSAGLKALAKELALPVVLVSQVNRENVREDRKPRVSDLAESGALEQDADTIILLHRWDGARGAQAVPAEANVAKSRNDMTGAVPLWWHPSRTAFSEADFGEWLRVVEAIEKAKAEAAKKAKGGK
jgi:replicative DNA helicase